MLNQVPEVRDYQIYAGTAAPINFNGLVRHYFMRSQSHQGDIQVNLLGRKQRHRDSHTIARQLRPQLNQIAQRFGGKVKVVEVPPGPPAWSPILAEVYGPTTEIRHAAARQVREIFRQTQDIVDVDIYLPELHQQWQVVIDRSKAVLLPRLLIRLRLLSVVNPLLIYTVNIASTPSRSRSKPPRLSRRA